MNEVGREAKGWRVQDKSALRPISQWEGGLYNLFVFSSEFPVRSRVYLMQVRALQSPAVSEFEISMGRCRTGETMEIPLDLQRSDEGQFWEESWILERGYLPNGRWDIWRGLTRFWFEFVGFCGHVMIRIEGILVGVGSVHCSLDFDDCSPISTNKCQHRRNPCFWELTLWWSKQIGVGIDRNPTLWAA
jgi:hypothetical protein